MKSWSIYSEALIIAVLHNTNKIENFINFIKYGFFNEHPLNDDVKYVISLECMFQFSDPNKRTREKHWIIPQPLHLYGI